MEIPGIRGLCILQAPEMARVPLEELVLQIHLLGLGPAAGFLAGVIEPPPDKSITGAVSQLQGIGALTPDEAFTPLGKPAHMHAFLASTWGYLRAPFWANPTPQGAPCRH